MVRYIDAEKLSELLYRMAQEEPDDEISDDYVDGWQEALSMAILKIDDIDVADVRPERHGKWSDKMISQEDEFREYGDFSFKDFHFGFQCSECGAILNKTPYCGNCGAKMDGKDGEDGEIR